MSRLRWPALVLLVTAVLSCSRTTKEKMLQLFFDDPPPVEEVSLVEPTQVDPGAEDPEVPPTVVTSRVQGSSHPPFADRDCGACHALGSSKSFLHEETDPVDNVPTGPRVRSRLILPADVLCFECHDDMAPESLQKQGAVVHAPVEDGECTECHKPHQAPFPSLLRMGDPLETLCFECHDAEDVLSVEPHEDLGPEERICTDCHDPHMSDAEKLLKM
jgi:predicted CXXCH cytochrome family protein